MDRTEAVSANAGCVRSERREQRRRLFVEVAERLFLERGFAGTSVNEVVRRAGGSLSTLYEEFPTKGDLFEAVVTRRATTMFDERTPAPAAGRSAREQVTELAARIQETALSADGLALFRLAVSEGPHFESLRRVMLDVSMERYLSRLAARIDEIARDCGLSVDDPRTAAGWLLALVAGQIQFAAACGDDARTTAQARARSLALAVDAFLAILRPTVE
jgi:AcrR family transcriptional regulator